MIGTTIPETDSRRKEIMWLALTLVAALGLALGLLLRTGFAFPAEDYDGAAALGLVILLGCAIAYFALKEKEQRQLNQGLVASLERAAHELGERAARVDELRHANARLAEALERLTLECDEDYLRTLRALMSTLDARDDYTALHGEHVAAVAVPIAQRMGLEPKVVDLLKRLAPLHDIGTIGIPDRILHKPQPLDADELAMCRQHALIGAAIIAPLRPSPEGLAIIRNHHERWDGRGYPDGLRGADIPLLARIVGVADAYHAILSRRPYHAARGRLQAVREMMTHSGSQFDPDIVGVLAHMVSNEGLDPIGVR